MKPHSIFLVRHGESAGNVDKSIYHTVPDWKIPLTEKGHQQALEAGKKFYKLLEVEKYWKEYRLYYPTSKPYRRLLQIYTSPWYRSRQTTQGILSGLDMHPEIVKEDPRLREQEWGNYQEAHLQDKIKKERHEYGSFFYRMPYGESGADAYDRVTSFMDTLYRDFEKEDFPLNVIISTHGLTIKIFLMRWFHWTVEEFEKYDTPDNCDIIRMDLKNNGKYKQMDQLKIYQD